MTPHPEPTPDEFKQWRAPVRGTRQAQRMDNPFWIWCIRSGASAYAANERFGGPDPQSAGPCWCFDRMGQARVELPDGREVLIAGEHEDHYDPDFYIYNDVVVIDGDEVAIRGYPEQDFPPTDFHTATLAGSDVWLIGNLGYPEDRAPAATQVLRLSTDDWRVEKIATTGPGPGWIHHHAAAYCEQDHAIRITGGKVCVGDEIRESIDDYQLCLKTLTWTKLTDRRWDRWTLAREDGSLNKLWEIRTVSMNREMGISMREQLAEAFADLPDELAAEMIPRASERQIESIKTLYQSPFSDEIATEDAEQYGRHRLNIDGVTVRFDEDAHHIVVTVEGQLPAAVTDALLSNLQARLAELEGAAYTLSRIEA